MRFTPVSIKRFLMTAGCLALILLLWNPVKRIAWSVRLGQSLQRLAQGNDGADLSVTAARVSRSNGNHTYEAIYYRPAETAASTAVIIVAGLSKEGCYHPQLVALSRTLAANGLMVITPDIREFREFQISAEPIEQMIFWHRQIATLAGGEGIHNIGIAGVSYSGTMAIIAASRPEIRDHTDFVMAIGPYFNLLNCAREWFAAGTVDEWKGYYPPRYYARWLLMRSALDMLPVPEERQFMDETIHALVASHRAPAIPNGMTSAGRRWYELATIRPGSTDTELATAIERHLMTILYDQLNPEKFLQELHSPLFLIHGEHDDLIPPRESVELHRQVRGSRLFITPFLTHTQPVDKPSTLQRKLTVGWDLFVFSYHLTAVLDR